MKSERILDALAQVEEAYIAQAAPGGKRVVPRGRLLRRGLALAACLCLAAAGGLALYRQANPWPVWEIPQSQASSGEIAQVPRWEELPLWAQYDQVIWEGREYQVMGESQVTQEDLGEPLAQVTAQGWDEYASQAGEDGSRHHPAQLRALEGINPQAAVAVQLQGEERWYTAVCSDYRPQTLGQFLEDLNLRETLVVNRAYYQRTTLLGGEETVILEPVDRPRLLAMLETAPQAENQYGGSLHDLPKEVLDLSVSLPLLGYDNISISLREGGWVLTNILSTGKLFQVGEEAAGDFVRYVLEECPGYRPRYTSSEERAAIPE